MGYELFLFDLDDTLLDFRASERRSFELTMEQFGLQAHTDHLYTTYQTVNSGLWTQFERGEVSKDHLKIERFRRVSETHDLALDAVSVSEAYLNALPTTVVLTEHAVELCAWLSGHGEIGIITNGIETVQTKRIANSAIAPYISFVCVSDACGYAKPDVRFFEHSSRQAKKFAKHSTLVVGDRLDADILGARNFGVDSCWFNPHRLPRPSEATPTYEIHHLSELRPLLGISTAQAC